MNKKNAGEIAVGIILLLAIVVVGIFWLNDKKYLNNERNIKEGEEIVLEGDVISISGADFLENPCVLSLEGSKKINVWFCKAIIEDANGSTMKADDLKIGFSITISGEVMGCPPGGMGPDDTLCVSANKIIIENAE